MKFKKLILKDFFRYYGYQEIDLSVPNNKSVIALIGDNGRGKTTILSAFNFVLYNTLLEPLTVDNMLNYRKQNEMKNGESSEAYVEVIIEEDNKEFILKRTTYFKKDMSGKIYNITSRDNGSLYRIESNGNKTEQNLKVFEDKFLIPQKLSGFFFFDGERINRLAKVDGKKEIKNAILNILGISYLENIRKDLTNIKKTVSDNLRKHTNNTDEQVLILRLQKAEDNKDKSEFRIKELEEELSKAEAKFDEISNKIINSNSIEVTELEQRRIKINKEIEEEKRNLKNIEREIKKHVGKNFKYFLAHKFIKDTSRILDEKKKEGVLPSNIKDTFIDDILNKGVCICGTCLQKDSNEYKELLKLKEIAGSRELDNAYYNLKSLIKKIKKEKETFYVKFDKLIELRQKRKEKIHDYRMEEESISNKLSNCDIEMIKELEEIRNGIKVDIHRKNQELARNKVNLENFDKEYKMLIDQLKVLESNNKHINTLKSKINIINELQQLNTDFKEMFTEIVREELDIKIKEVFSKITNKDYRIPVLTKDFELKITSKLNQIGIDEEEKNDEMLSTGEGQITSLSFIGALVAYARENKNDNVMSRLSGDEYPIVMDSPFGNLDESHTENVAKNIGKLASQVIIIVSQKQWKGHVENNIIDQINRKYIIKDCDVNKIGAECSFIEEVI